MFDFTLGPLDHGFDGIAHRVLGDLCFSKLKSVAKNRHVAEVVPQLINIALRLFPEPFEQEAAIMFGREDLRPLRQTEGSELTFESEPQVAGERVASKASIVGSIIESESES